MPRRRERRPPADKLVRRFVFAVLLVDMLACPALPAAPQLGATVSLASDYRFRGRSLSGGRPVGTLNLSYDDPSGIYLGASASGVDTRHAGIQLLGAQGSIGYAQRLESGLVLDLGLTRADYTEYYSGGSRASYSEAYVGLIGDRFAAHLHYSPHYFGRGSAVYGDVDATIRPATTWRLNAHVGLLAPSGGPYSMRGEAVQYDWRVAMATEGRPLELQLAVSGGGPRPDYYGQKRHSTKALVMSATYIF